MPVARDGVVALAWDRRGGIGLLDSWEETGRVTGAVVETVRCGLVVLVS